MFELPVCSDFITRVHAHTHTLEGTLLRTFHMVPDSVCMANTQNPAKLFVYYVVCFGK